MCKGTSGYLCGQISAAPPGLEPTDVFLSLQGELRQMTFLMGDSDTAKDHCTLYSTECGVSKAPWSTHKTQVNQALTL